MNDEEQEIIDDVEPTTEPTTEPDPITGETDVEDESEEFDEDMAEETPQDGDNTPDLRAVTALATRTVQVDEIITDYSAESLAAYEAAGFTAYAVYDDGTEVQVPWSSVTEPPTLNDVISLEGLDVAMANNQHFWQRSTDPDQDGAGTGAFVTDDEQDDFLEAAADGFDDLSDQKPWHNLLMNSLGILLRTGLNNLVSITRSAIAFFDGKGNAASNIVARFGKDGFQVGLDNESHLIGDYHSLQLIDKNGSTYFHVSDLRDADGSATFVDRFTGDNTTSSYTVGMVPDEVISVTVGGEAKPYTQDGQTFTFNQVVTTGQGVVITYKSSDPTTKAYTFGKRKSGSTLGALSVAEGLDTKATFPYSHAEGCRTAAEGHASHAEGNQTTASGPGAHAEGSSTSALGNYSHAEGNGSNAKAHYSHVEGNSTVYPGAIYAHAEGVSTCAMDAAYSHAEGYSTKAGANYAHAEGGGTRATGAYSHAQNRYTLASSTSQTALGMYNVEDANDVYAVIVGNGAGTSSSQCSNALTLDWNGIVGAQNVGMYGTCDTAAATAAKVATLDDYGVKFKLVKGAVVRIYMANSNTVADPTLNVNGTGAKAIKRYGTTAPSTASGSSWIGGTVMTFLYDGTYWRLCDYRNNDNTVPSAYCSTAAATAAKVASCSGYALKNPSWLHVIITAANTAASALTLNVNSKGAKPIYINGSASSSSNYTLPAGSYLVRYDGTAYQFRTDSHLPIATLPVSQGGSGQTSVSSYTSGKVTAGTSVTINEEVFKRWGKVVTFRFYYKRSAAVTSGNTLVGTISDTALRPGTTVIVPLSGVGAGINAYIDSAGKIYHHGAITANAGYVFGVTYVTA